MGRPVSAARTVTEFAVEITWVDHVKAGAKGRRGIYGWLEDRTQVDLIREAYRRDRAIEATRVLTRTATYTDPVEHEPLEVITPEIRDAALTRYLGEIKR